MPLNLNKNSRALKLSQLTKLIQKEQNLRTADVKFEISSHILCRSIKLASFFVSWQVSFNPIGQNKAAICNIIERESDGGK